jgi:hypothetical protein
VRAAERPTTVLPCTYAGIRVAGQVYVEYSRVPDAKGDCVPAFEREHYDLASDPFQLNNLAPATPGTPAAAAQAALSERLASLVDCAGVAGAVVSHPPPRCRPAATTASRRRERARRRCDARHGARGRPLV